MGIFYLTPLFSGPTALMINVFSILVLIALMAQGLSIPAGRYS
jgi:hypothetical protein